MILSIILACYGDVSIIKREPQDTSGVIITDEPTQEPSSISDPAFEPSWEPSGEPSYEQTERSGITGYTYLKLRQVACPACMGETQQISIQFKALFHEPSSDGHTEWLPPNGQCTNSLISTSPSVVPIDVGPSIYIEGEYHTFTANPFTYGSYENNQIWESHLERDSRYDIFTTEGNYSFISSHGFDFIEPYTMLWVDPLYAFEAPIYRTGAIFTWGPSSSDSVFMITVSAYSWDGSQFLGYVTCTGPDNGSMMIPSQYLQGFQPGSLTAIHLSRHKIELVETDINNSYIETHMEWEVVGTGHIE
jgi:hypothetical protein|tara:strand:+ start:875 stop:1789 length:915 start_codon:yes stop_codon:yes gene_type:complete